MRLLFGTFVLLIVTLASRPAVAETIHPWCVHYSMNGEVTNCGFVSWEQCRMTAAGAGGFCAQNPFYVAAHPAAKANPATKRRPNT